MFARFDKNPAMTLQDIKETKRYGRTHGRTHGRTENKKTVYPPQTKFAGVIIVLVDYHVGAGWLGLLSVLKWLFCC